MNAGPEQPDPVVTPEGQDELVLLAGWLQQIAASGGDIARLLVLELRLAVGDSGRLLLLAVLSLPLLLLAWTGFAVLVSWLVYQYDASVTMALLAFLLLQLSALAVIHVLIRQYRKSLSLPLTRHHIQSFLGTPDSEPQVPDH